MGDRIPVNVRMTTEHTGKDQVVEREQLEAVGQASFTAERWVVHFPERSGRTTIEANDEQLTLIRSGEVAMHQVFIPKQKTRGTYRHVYGSLDMLTTTTELYRFERNDEWQIGWRYLLDLNGTGVGSFHIHVAISERKEHRKWEEGVMDE